MGMSYGVIVPSSSLALAECYSQRMQPLVVSVRQTGVPVGTAMVALIAPFVAQHFGWQTMIALVLAVVAGTFALSLPGLRPFAAIAANPPHRQNLLAALRGALSEPATRRLALVAGVYGINQAALTTYLVPGLVWLHGLTVGICAGCESRNGTPSCIRSTTNFGSFYARCLSGVISSGYAFGAIPRNFPATAWDTGADTDPSGRSGVARDAGLREPLSPRHQPCLGSPGDQRSRAAQ